MRQSWTRGFCRSGARAAPGGVGAAVRAAREARPDLPLEVECRDEAEVREALGLPEDAITMALIPLGYPAKGRWSQPKRRPLEEVVHFDTYGNLGSR